MCIFLFNFISHSATVFPKWLSMLHSHRNVFAFQLLHILTRTCHGQPGFSFNHSGRCVVVSTVVLICSSLKTNDFENLFMGFFATHIPPFVKCLIKYLPALLWSFSWLIMSSSYTLEMSPWLGRYVYVANMSNQSPKKPKESLLGQCLSGDENCLGFRYSQSIWQWRRHTALWEPTAERDLFSIKMAPKHNQPVPLL